MLNKELFMGKPQINKIYLTVGYYEDVWWGERFGVNTEKHIGSISAIPKWGGKALEYCYIEVGKLKDSPTKYKYSRYVPSSDSVKQITMITESGSVTLEKLPKYSNYVYNSDYDVLNFTESIGKTIEITFDPLPPPRRLFGSRNTQTNLGRGYYVEEVPWEAQDAE